MITVSKTVTSSPQCRMCPPLKLLHIDRYCNRSDSRRSIPKSKNRLPHLQRPVGPCSCQATANRWPSFVESDLKISATLRRVIVQTVPLAVGLGYLIIPVRGADPDRAGRSAQSPYWRL